jgi:hypothetical protein
MDEVQYNDRGNEVLLLKRRDLLPSSLRADPDTAVLSDLSTAS